MEELAHHKIIWTIGHSIHTLERFITMLDSFKIRLVADIRSYPGSGRYPHFNKEALQNSLAENDIDYVHLKELGGRRAVKQNSKNTVWRNIAFRGYADYMETDAFKQGVNTLEEIALMQRTAYMCSEAVWWRCHRSLVSDYLKVNGWSVMHIMGTGKAEEHPYTKPARIVNGTLTYRKEEKERNETSTLF